MLIIMSLVFIINSAIPRETIGKFLKCDKIYINFTNKDEIYSIYYKVYIY